MLSPTLQIVMHRHNADRLYDDSERRRLVPGEHLALDLVQEWIPQGGIEVCRGVVSSKLLAQCHHLRMSAHPLLLCHGHADHPSKCAVGVMAGRHDTRGIGRREYQVKVSIGVEGLWGVEKLAPTEMAWCC